MQAMRYSAVLAIYLTHLSPCFGAALPVDQPELSAKAKRIVIGDVTEAFGFRDTTDGALKTCVVVDGCEYLLGGLKSAVPGSTGIEWTG